MRIKFMTGKTYARFTQQINNLQTQISEATQFISTIKNGDMNASISETLVGKELGQSLTDVQEHLKRLATEEEQRNWLNVGLARFADIMRNKNSLSLQNLSDEILSNLIKYINANQGALFVMEGSDQEQYLNMIACYAYERKKYLNKRIELGQGLAGQCVLEREPIYMKAVPQDYVSITSGLGEATPRSVFIVPLMVNENVFGVLELASFTDFEQHTRDFVIKLSENIAATVKNVKDNERTITLLNASREQTEALQAQEEEMRQNMEELQATQEEMARKSDELNHAAAEMTGMLEGINATMATIEFTPEGIILNANQIFQSVMECKLENIKGKHHRMFVPDEILNSSDYKNFWKNLANGKALHGIFKRNTLSGSTVWLSAIYNPIKDASGQIVKVIKFATNITEQQETLATSKGILEGINATMATIEFEPDGTIIRANRNFLNVMDCNLNQIQGQHHRMFVTRDVQETDEYKSFWLRLSKGESITGIFKRASLSGKIIWLNAIYNPIVNANGDVIKVIKFATDITAQQESLAETKGILSGINATMATIEFKPDGTIINANDNFLSVMGYSLNEIRRKHHRMFVLSHEQESDEYQKFWNRLASGESFSGTFKRITSSGNTIWLNAIYNPIVNASGEVVKVIKFANDITAQQSKATETEQIMDIVTMKN